MKESTYPKIRRLAAEEGASIFFEDEASVRTDRHAGTTWASAGHTRSSSRPASARRFSVVSAISPRGKLRFRMQDVRMNAGPFIDFVKTLLGSVDGKIFLIVHTHPGS